MKTKKICKAFIASLLVTASLAAPIAVLSATTPPLEAELIFEILEGESLVFHTDGSVQLIVNVAVDDAVNCRGASFHMNYNKDYLEPSYIADTADGKHTVNEAISTGGLQENDGFFREDKDLFGGMKDANGETIQVINHHSDRPIWVGGKPVMDAFYSYVDPGTGAIDMQLWLDDEVIAKALDDAADKDNGEEAAPGAGVLTRLNHVNNDPDAKVYVFNKHDEVTETNQDPGKVILGQLSFRVKEDRLAEVIGLFDGLDVLGDYRKLPTVPDRPWVDLVTPDNAKHDKTYLLDINRSLGLSQDPWQIGYYEGEEYQRTEEYYAPDSSDQTARNVAEHFKFEFNRDMIVAVELTNPDVTINAYQNYTSGSTHDLQLSMGRYANMVTVTYADGTKENRPFPWGYSGSGYTAQYVEKKNLDDTKTWAEMTTSPITAYDPTANVANPGVGTDYIFTQSYQVYKTEADGSYKKRADGSGLYEVAYTFPIPVVGHLRVTPIQVLDVTAEDLTRTYPLDDVLNQVRDANDLNLPDQARIITDIVPGNVSLVTPIKGWTPIQPDSWTSGDPYSTWPTGAAAGAMNSLKAKNYTPIPDGGTIGEPTGSEGYPYWPDPDNGDSLHIINPASPDYAPKHYIGDYYFETADKPGGAAQGILRADIQASFPWLTVPQPEYALDNALRRIVQGASFGDYADAKDYEVQYVSTVTETADNGKGQPTLTLSVSRANDANMADGSVFRVWLPNGLELGTGQQKGGVKVDNWFNDASKSAADPDYHTHVNGFYNTKGLTEAGSVQQIFHLNTNPSDPELPASTATADYHNSDRETLRRYINLGGWYQVAICEDPDDVDPLWTDPIPVYVPPRRNEYQESKIYNFIGENAGLFNWPGGVSAYLAFPQGTYQPVSPTASISSIGLPLYQLGDIVTDATTDADQIFVDNNPYRLQDGVSRFEESYGVKTTYDGQTGAQPGEIFSLKIDAADTTHTADWSYPNNTDRLHESVDPATPPARSTLYTYGPTPLFDGHLVPGFGTVNQPEADLDTYRATLRRQLEEKDSQDLLEKVTLTSTADDGIKRVIQNDKSSNVTLVTFNTVTEGYTVRQDHLLTINNVGDVDIYGLTIDSLVDGYELNDNDNRDAPEGGHFEITVPPADFLPAGSSTNFVLTYVYDLRAAANGDILDYRDTLYITSTSHPEAGKDKDHLLDFDAELKVSGDDLHQVTVVYRPIDGTMGTGKLVVGEQVVGDETIMNDTPTTRTYPEKESVYVMIDKVDEYAVKSMKTEIDGVTVDLLNNNKYAPALSLPNDPGFKGDAVIDETENEVYVFEMPGHDVVVYVDFYEPITSKLRLDHLIDFSAPPPAGDPDAIDLVDGYDATNAYQPTEQDHIYKVWKKQFSGAPAQGTTAATGDYADAIAWSTSTGGGYSEDFYLMTTGAAIPATQQGDVYDSSNKHYLVVIDAEDDFSQIKAQLRSVQYHVDYRGQLTDPTDPDYAKYKDGYNLDVRPTVNMTVYYDHSKYRTFTGSGSYADSNGKTVNPGDYIDASGNLVLTGDKDPRLELGVSLTAAQYDAITIFESNVLGDWTGLSNDAVYDNGHGYGPYDATPPNANLRPQGSTADKTIHISSDFDSTYPGFESPDPGHSAYVHIRVSFPGDADDAAGERDYYVEIHRRTKEADVVLHYGNAPYGMIMNEEKFITDPADPTDPDSVAAAQARTEADRTMIKKAFCAGYTFKGADASVLPDAAKGKLQTATYWREAWVRNEGLFEPESLTGFTQSKNSDGSLKFEDEGKTRPVYEPIKSIYNEADNLDLNDYAFFAILGQEMWEPGVISAKDSSGRDVDLYDIKARALDMNAKDGVTLLDTTKTKQVERFSGTDTAVIDLGVAGQKLTPLAEHANPAVTVATDSVLGVTQWPAKTTTTTTTPEGGGESVTTTSHTVVEDIRPGRYVIEYSYLDFDGVSTLRVTRPFVILRDVGDVNVDGLRDSVRLPATGSAAAKSDEYAIEDRITHDPLGYEAGKWDETLGKQTVYPYANIFKFRVADVNNDRNINNIDANQVAKNVKDKGGWLSFYDPVNYGHPGSPITAPATGS